MEGESHREGRAFIERRDTLGHAIAIFVFNEANAVGFRALITLGSEVGMALDDKHAPFAIDSQTRGRDDRGAGDRGQMKPRIPTAAGALAVCANAVDMINPHNRPVIARPLLATLPSVAWRRQADFRVARAVSMGLSSDRAREHATTRRGRVNAGSWRSLWATAQSCQNDRDLPRGGTLPNAAVNRSTGFLQNHERNPPNSGIGVVGGPLGGVTTANTSIGWHPAARHKSSSHHSRSPGSHPKYAGAAVDRTIGQLDRGTTG